MPITNGRYVNPGWVNGQPPAINASELNAVSDTLERLTDPGGRRGGYVVVGTSTEGATAFDCDFLCDGTADDVEINAAIEMAQTLNMDVFLLNGVYKLSSPITPYCNMLITGQYTGSTDFLFPGTIYSPNRAYLAAQSTSVNTLIAPQATITTLPSIRLSHISIGDGTFAQPAESLIDVSSSSTASFYLDDVKMYTESQYGIKGAYNSNYFLASNCEFMYTTFSGLRDSYFSGCLFLYVSFENCGTPLASEGGNFLYSNTFIGDITLTDCSEMSFFGNQLASVTLTAVANGAGNVICGLNNFSFNLFSGGGGITLGENTRYNMVTNNGGVNYNGGSSFSPWAGVTDNGSNNYVANNMPTS